MLETTWWVTIKSLESIFLIPYLDLTVIQAVGGVRNKIVVYMFFLRNLLYLGRTDVTSFCMHFEKIGCGLLREGKQREGEWAVWGKRRGDE